MNKLTKLYHNTKFWAVCNAVAMLCALVAAVRGEYGTAAIAVLSALLCVGAIMETEQCKRK